jgi:hypothetical protein
MSAAQIELELNEYLDTSGYEVRFRRFASESMLVTVTYQGEWLAEDIRLRGRRRYSRAAKWAKRQVADHQRALATLGPLWHPKEPVREQVLS